MPLLTETERRAYARAAFGNFQGNAQPPRLNPPRVRPGETVETWDFHGEPGRFYLSSYPVVHAGIAQWKLCRALRPWETLQAARSEFVPERLGEGWYYRLLLCSACERRHGNEYAYSYVSTFAVVAGPVEGLDLPF